MFDFGNLRTSSDGDPDDDVDDDGDDGEDDDDDGQVPMI